MRLAGTQPLRLRAYRSRTGPTVVRIALPLALARRTFLISPHDADYCADMRVNPAVGAGETAGESARSDDGGLGESIVAVPVNLDSSASLTFLTV